MIRLLATLKTDFAVQWRNRLYAIGIAVALIIAIALSQLARPEHFSWLIPSLMLIVVGGTTMLYVAGMIIFERDEGTLKAVIASPLRPSEYLWSKVLSLTALATLESVVMIGGAMMIVGGAVPAGFPNVPILVAGIVAIGLMYTLIGIVLVARYQKITDFLIPMAMVAVVLQIPILYFLGMVEHPLLLVVPTSAPTMIMQGAYRPLGTGQWVYAVSYTVVTNVALAFWAYRAFQIHVVQKAG